MTTARGHRFLANPKGELAFLAGLYAMGLLFWARLFNWGRLYWDTGDWVINIIYFRPLMEHLARFDLPLHTNMALHVTETFSGTDRFWGIPDLMVSPQIFLSPFLGLEFFIYFNLLLLYTVGFFGVWALGRRLALAPLPFFMLFILMMFNGFAVTHLAIGHMMWVCSFLLPWFFLFALEMAEDASPTSSVKTALTLFVMVLHGGWHFMLWCSFFLLLTAVGNRRLLRPVAYTFVWAGLLSAFRFLPAMVTFSGKPHSFVSGIPSVSHFFRGMADIVPCCVELVKGYAHIMNWWEVDFFIGAGGLLFIVLFGVGMRFAGPWKGEGDAFRTFDLPVLGMFILSLGGIYSLVHTLHIPFLNGERVSSRFFIMPLMFLAIVAAVRFGRFMHGRDRRSHAVGWGAALFVLYRLWAHALVWDVKDVHLSQIPRLPTPPVQVVERADPLFAAVSYGSMAVTALTLGAAFVYLRRVKATSSVSE